jgi:hypothetical protein
MRCTLGWAGQARALAGTQHPAPAAVAGSVALGLARERELGSAIYEPSRPQQADIDLATACCV